jgi:hypothetical protein
MAESGILDFMRAAGLPIVALGFALVGCAPAVSIPPGGTALFKCKYSDVGCRQDAAAACPGGSYHVVSESTHAGGLLADALPGPMTWYDVVAACGPDLGSFDVRVAALQRKHDAEIVWPKCENPPKPGRCGLISDELMRGDYRERFVRDRCQEDPTGAEVSEACVGLFYQALKGALRRSYPRAIEPEIQRFCDSEPSKCDGISQVELQWLISHDAHVDAYYEALVDDLVRATAQAEQNAAIARQAEADAAERRRATFQAFAAGLQAAGGALSNAGAASQTPAMGCTNDFVCGGPGRVCVKPPNMMVGTCAQAVTPYGVQDFSRAPRPSSTGPGHADCGFGGTCPAMFQCIQGHCMRQ